MGLINLKQGPFVPDGGYPEEKGKPRGILEQMERMRNGLPREVPTGILAEIEREDRERVRELGIVDREKDWQEGVWGPLGAPPGPEEAFFDTWVRIILQPAGEVPPATPAMVAKAMVRGWEVEGRTAVALKGATLSGLAEAITGSPEDYKLLGFDRDPKRLGIGDKVDILVLLEKVTGEGVGIVPGTKGSAIDGLPEIPEMSGAQSADGRKLWLKSVAAHAIQAKKDSGHKMFVSTQLAICAFETGWGTSKSFLQGHNVGGVKGRGDAGGGRYGTEEVESATGERVSIRDTFAHYTSLVEAFKAQGRLTLTKRYAATATAASPKEQVERLYDAGYATEEREVWVGGVQSIIDKYDLRKYDQP